MTMSGGARAGDVLMRTIAPIVLACLAGGIAMWAVGVDATAFFADVLSYGLGGQGWQQTLTAMAPLLLVALGLIVAFRARLWNLGYSGTYLLAAAVVSGVAPDAMRMLPFGLATVALLALAIVVGVALALVPALLKAKYAINEVVTSLMMSFIAMSVANLCIRGVFQDPAVSVPQTRVLDLDYMLPYLPGTRVHVGFVLALAAVVVVHVLLTRSTLGLKIDMLGASPRATAHAGINVARLTVTVFVLSGALIAVAGVIDMLGLWGYTRAGWNPGYGDKILPFVFLARLSPLGSVPLVGFYAVFATGGTIAAQRAGLSVDVLTVFVALVLFFMVVIEFLGARQDRLRAGRGHPGSGARLGRSYLPGGLGEGLRP